MTGDAPIILDATTGAPEEPESPPRSSGGLSRISELSWRLLAVVLAIALIAYVLWQIRLVVLPLLIAVLLTTLLHPAAQLLRSRGVPNTLASVAVFLGGVGVFVGAISLVVRAVVDALTDLVASVQAGIGELGDLLVEGPLGLSQVEAQQTIREAEQRLTNSVDSIASGVLSGAMLVGEVLAGALIVLVLLFFFIKDGPLIWAWVTRLFGKRGRQTVERVGEASWTALSQYVRGIVFVATFDAVFIGLALALIGVPLVIPLAVLTFIAAFIPFAGAFTAGAVAALVALVSNGVVAALLVVLAVLVVQVLEGNVLYPLIVGRSMHLHPVGILLAVTTGAVLAGIIGALVAVPIMAVVNAAVPIIRSDDQARGSARALVAARSEPPPPA
ncbi:MAG TPA: AI-2E family transporter [Solirubrobacteraceae bacterium]|nr:AI-2E family transporter [Solirubrobacteraceae bacterium]